ncbi:hypothetical protein [Sagittula stellata]|uniref:hypothetical protein n=1 Tax=Sagittula stellata TaxID=52603 RepID=UPI0012F4D91A|nr:hypothetical protein [Sagittula stellata]
MSLSRTIYLDEDRSGADNPAKLENAASRMIETQRFTPPQEEQVSGASDASAVCPFAVRAVPLTACLMHATGKELRLAGNVRR